MPTPPPPGAHEAEEYTSETLTEELTEADLYGATTLGTAEGLAPEEPAETDLLAPGPAEEPPAGLEELIPDAAPRSAPESRARRAHPARRRTREPRTPVRPTRTARTPARRTRTPTRTPPIRTARTPAPWTTRPRAAPRPTRQPTPSPIPEPPRKRPAPDRPAHGLAVPSHKPTHKPTPAPPTSRRRPLPLPDRPPGRPGGGGGAFTDSVPAQVAGGLLIAGAFGAHRLLSRRSGRARY
ncbi:hypothetical protein ACFQV4_37875 [Streptomyces thermocarboxydus]